MFFICQHFVVALLIDRCALATDTGRYSTDPWRLDHPLVVIDTPDAVIIGVADVHFDVAPFLVVQRRDPTWLIEARLERCLVLYVVFAVA